MPKTSAYLADIIEQSSKREDGWAPEPTKVNGTRYSYGVGNTLVRQGVLEMKFEVTPGGGSIRVFRPVTK